MLKFSKASHPFWVDAAQTGISLLVTFEGLGEVPFTARPDDSEPHGRDIFERAVAGEFGEVASFTPPSTEQLGADAAYQKRRLLQIAAERLAPLEDAVELQIETAEERERLQNWKRYRIELNRVEQQPGYPQTVTWPQSPEP